MSEASTIVGEAAGKLTLPQTLEFARQARANGTLAEAEQFYRQALVMMPSHADAKAELAAVLEARGAASEAQAARNEAGEAAIASASVMAASLLDTPLQNRAPTVLQKAVAAYPDLAAGPLAQCELSRRLGDLPAALSAAQNCLRLDPANERAVWLEASLRGLRLEPNAKFLSPAPLRVFDDFFPPALHGELLQFALQHDSDLQPSTTGGPHARENWRRSKVDRKPPVALRVLPDIRREAIAALAGFGLQPSDIVSPDVQFTAHNEGDFYHVHRDWAPDDTDGRRVTFVYYLHRQPRGFAGGGLRLFDSMIDGGQYFEAAYSKVEPADNRLVIFPSYVWHAVEPVTCASRRYEDGRFTLNGWLGIAKD